MLQTGAFPSHTEILTGAAAGDDINNGDLRAVDFRDVSEVLHPPASVILSFTARSSFFTSSPHVLYAVSTLTRFAL